MLQTIESIIFWLAIVVGFFAMGFASGFLYFYTHNDIGIENMQSIHELETRAKNIETQHGIALNTLRGVICKIDSQTDELLYKYEKICVE